MKSYTMRMTPSEVILRRLWEPYDQEDGSEDALSLRQDILQTSGIGED